MKSNHQYTALQQAYIKQYLDKQVNEIQIRCLSCQNIEILSYGITRRNKKK